MDAYIQRRLSEDEELREVKESFAAYAGLGCFSVDIRQVTADFVSKKNELSEKYRKEYEAGL